jgi:hypothetical protein
LRFVGGGVDGPGDRYGGRLGSDFSGQDGEDAVGDGFRRTVVLLIEGVVLEAEELAEAVSEVDCVIEFDLDEGCGSVFLIGDGGNAQLVEVPKHVVVGGQDWADFLGPSEFEGDEAASIGRIEW